MACFLKNYGSFFTKYEIFIKIKSWKFYGGRHTYDFNLKPKWVCRKFNFLLKWRAQFSPATIIIKVKQTFFQKIILLIYINSIFYWTGKFILKFNNKNEILVRFRARNMVFMIIENKNSPFFCFLSIFGLMKRQLLNYFSYLKAIWNW